MLSHIFLAVVSNVVQKLLAVILFFMPLDYIEGALLLLKPLQHLLVLKNDILVVSEPLFKIEGLL